MITRVDPPDFRTVSSVQVDSNADNPWVAIEEIESWAAENGFVRTSEYHPRHVLIDGGRQFRSVCYPVSDEERAAIELAHRQMSERAEALRGVLPRGARE
jgi:hypothetical protein